ncbi:hypothetical protein OH492_18820 [Vibrio chagasii]|nr:hypothetical protein [Vibrio chagasii]
MFVMLGGFVGDQLSYFIIKVGQNSLKEAFIRFRPKTKKSDRVRVVISLRRRRVHHSGGSPFGPIAGLFLALSPVLTVWAAQFCRCPR